MSRTRPIASSVRSSISRSSTAPAEHREDDPDEGGVVADRERREGPVAELLERGPGELGQLAAASTATRTDAPPATSWAAIGTSATGRSISGSANAASIRRDAGERQPLAVHPAEDRRVGADDRADVGHEAVRAPRSAPAASGSRVSSTRARIRRVSSRSSREPALDGLDEPGVLHRGGDECCGLVHDRPRRLDRGRWRQPRARIPISRSGEAEPDDDEMLDPVVEDGGPDILAEGRRRDVRADVGGGRLEGLGERTTELAEADDHVDERLADPVPAGGLIEPVGRSDEAGVGTGGPAQDLDRGLGDLGPGPGVAGRDDERAEGRELGLEPG